jgi:hypothetical protein
MPLSAGSAVYHNTMKLRSIDPKGSAVNNARMATIVAMKRKRAFLRLVRLLVDKGIETFSYPYGRKGIQFHFMLLFATRIKGTTRIAAIGKTRLSMLLTCVSLPTVH